MKSITIAMAALAIGAGSLKSDTIYFDDLDRAPAEQLDIGGVTITLGSRGIGQPSTVAGLGLGVAGLGSNGIVERMSSNNSYGLGESLLLTAPGGQITSLTLIPYFDDLSTPGTDFVSFDMLASNGYQRYLRFIAAEPMTIPFQSWEISPIDLSMSSDFGPGFNFAGYWQEHPEAQLVYGFSVQSLDYTPRINSVPEGGSTFAMFGIAAGLLGWQARRRECLD
jgi:hypothetical protein